MTEKEVQEKSFILYTKLLDKGAIERNNEAAIPYLQEEKVRLCIHRLASAQGTEVFESGEHLHLITLPEGSIFATSYSQGKASRSNLEVVDWYIISFIQMVFCWEVDNDFSYKLSIEREGVTYPQLEEKTSKLFSDWRQIDEEEEGAFSEEFKIAVHRINEKWDKLQYKNPKFKHSLNSRAGLVHKAMLLFKEGKLVHISDAHKRANIVYPTDILYERLDYIFSNMERYQVLKNLVAGSLKDYKSENELFNILGDDIVEMGGTS